MHAGLGKVKFETDKRPPTAVEAIDDQLTLERLHQMDDGSCEDPEQVNKALSRSVRVAALPRTPE